MKVTVSPPPPFLLLQWALALDNGGHHFENPKNHRMPWLEIILKVAGKIFYLNSVLETERFLPKTMSQTLTFITVIYNTYFNLAKQPRCKDNFYL